MKELYKIKNLHALIAIYNLAQKNIIDELKGSNCENENRIALTKQLSILAGKPLSDIKEEDALIELISEFSKIIEAVNNTSPIFENPRENPFLVYLSEIEAEKYVLFLEPVHTLEYEQKAEPLLSLYCVSNNEKKPFKKPIKTVLDVKQEIILLNFHFLIRRTIEESMKKRYPLFSLPLFATKKAIKVWKNSLKCKLSLLNHPGNTPNILTLISTLAMSEENSMLYNEIYDKKNFLQALIESVDSLDSSLTAAEILNQKIELELQLHQHTSLKP